MVFFLQITSIVVENSPYLTTPGGLNDGKYEFSASDRAAKRMSKLKKNLKLSSVSPKKKSAIDRWKDKKRGIIYVNAHRATEIDPSEFNLNSWKADLVVKPREIAMEFTFPFQQSELSSPRCFKSQRKRPVAIKNVRKKRRSNKQKEDIESDEKRIELFQWLEKNKSSNKMPDASELFSNEMNQIIQDKMGNELGSGFWNDDVGSTIAQAQDLNTVFGAGGEFRGPKYQQTVVMESNIKQDSVLVLADSMKEQAALLFQQGKVSESMQCYDKGVEVLLESVPLEHLPPKVDGFDYSEEANDSATKLQATYRSHFTRRTLALIVLQRYGRGHIARARKRALIKYRGINACYIQKFMLKRLLRRNLNAIQIQRRIRGVLGRKRALELRKYYASIEIQRRVRGILGRAVFREYRRTKSIYQSIRYRKSVFIQRQFRAFRDIKRVVMIQKIFRGHLVRYRTQLHRTIGHYGLGWLCRMRYHRMMQDCINREIKRFELEEKTIELKTLQRLKDFETFLKTLKGKKRLETQVCLIQAKEKRLAKSRQDLSKEDRKRLEVQDLFDRYDLDASGCIDIDEFHILVTELGLSLSKAQVTEIMKMIDQDGSDEIDFAEFFQWFTNQKDSASSADLAAIQFKLAKKKVMNLVTRDDSIQYANRILCHKETLAIQVKARSVFRETHPPAFECPYCHQPFPLYRMKYRHQCMKRRMPADAGASFERQRRVAEETEIEECEIEAIDKLMAFLDTKSGQEALLNEQMRLKALGIGVGTDTKSIFEEYDTDGSGAIDLDEFKQLIRELGMVLSEKEIRETMDRLDDDHSGEISYPEFELWYNSTSSTTSSSQKMKHMMLKGSLFYEKVSGKKDKERAIRFLRAKVRFQAKQQARIDFREKYPPDYVCIHCAQAFESTKELQHHNDTSDALHEQQIVDHEALVQRLGLNVEFQPTEAQEESEFEMDAAVTRARAFLQTKHGQAEILRQMQLLLVKPRDGQDKLRYLFDLFDVDQSGSISKLELKLLLGHLSLANDDSSVDAVMKQVDDDESGEIQFEELQEWHKNQSTSFFSRLKTQFGRKDKLREYAQEILIVKWTQQILNGDILAPSEGNELPESSKIAPMGQEPHKRAQDLLNSYLKTKEGKAEMKKMEKELKHVQYGLQQAFESFDLDQSGDIDSLEFRRLLVTELQLDLSEEEFLNVLHQVDADGSGSIEFQEFKDWFETYQPPKTSKLSRWTHRFRHPTTTDRAKRILLQRFMKQVLVREDLEGNTSS